MTKFHHFYGKAIAREKEAEYIRSLLKKYDNAKVCQELQKAIYDELQKEKAKGNISIPFKVVMKCDSTKKYRDIIEIILDTKV